MEAFTEQRNICTRLHPTNLYWCPTHTTHFLSRSMHFLHICHSSYGMNWSLFIHNVHRDPAACIFYKMTAWASKSPYHHLTLTQELSHLHNGMWHLHFPNLVLLLMHPHSDSHPKVNVRSMELTGLRVFANWITIKPSLRQKMRPSS